MSLVLAHLLLLWFLADVRGCVCDPARPETMQRRECSLTRAAQETPGAGPAVFKPDANPTKPNRWLAIPHALRHRLDDMTAAERAAYWGAAIEKATALWGDQWGIAINSEERRSQCQLHAHIGKLLPDADRSGGVLASHVEEIPLPEKDLGIWIQPEGKQLRVHLDQAAPETLLMR
jgi:CDP-diacylglycerol pyrophosphatase